MTPLINLQSIVDNLLSDTLQVSLPAFRPELVLCVTIVVMLFARLFKLGQKIDPFLLAMAGAIGAFCCALPAGGMAKLNEVVSQEIFTGMLVYDSLTVYLRLFLLLFVILFLVLVRMTGLADKQDGQDFYTLLLGATLGMCIMASANHLMTVFLGIEMASVPSYVLTGIVLGRQRAGEAALKYAIYGAGAAGVMLYGISLLAGLLGSAHLPTIAQRLIEMDIPEKIAAGGETGPLMVLVLAALMIMVGLAFKLSAVPFHFWCPDVFEGASAEVDAFLSVASKAAALVLLVRVVLGVCGVAEGPVAEATLAGGTLAPVRDFLVKLLSILAIVTCTFGNLAAYGQTNIKRMLAYSTIAHAGYMMMAVAAAVHLVGSNNPLAGEAISALLFYLSMYLFMNLAAFAIVAFLRNAMQSEEIADYAGLIRSCPLIGIALTGVLVSLIGLPPMAGFIGKYAIFLALVKAGGPWMITLLVVAGLNTAVSLVYYLRVAKIVCIDPEPDNRGPVTLGILPTAYVLLVALPVFYYGVFPESVVQWAKQAGAGLWL